MAINASPTFPDVKSVVTSGGYSTLTFPRTYLNANGAFKSRSELKKVTRLGEKAFEQAAGFLRIRSAENPLDASAVHPERYNLVEQMAKDFNVL